MNKERADVLLVEQGLFNSREKAKASIMAGQVYIGTERIEKAGTKVPTASKFELKGAVHPYVGRGGLKLDKAIEHFHLDLNGAVMLDIGASTGGFSDCALQHGADYVYAIDVGYNQLDWKLRNCEKVKVMERTNFRYLTADDLSGPVPNFAAIDVSFISLFKILPVLCKVLPPQGTVVALIKPQFEAGKGQVGKSGIVKDKSIHRQVLQQVLEEADRLGLRLKGLTYSPITGGSGNIEFLAYWQHRGQGSQDPSLPFSVEEVVAEAHQCLVSQEKS